MDSSFIRVIELENLNLIGGESIVIITHAGTIRAVLSHALNIKPDFAIGIEIQYQSISIFEMLKTKDSKFKGGRLRLLDINKK